MAETQNMPLDRNAIAPVTGYSTKQMMEKLCIKSNKLDSLIEASKSTGEDIHFKQMVILEHFGANNYNESREEPQALKQVTRIIDGNIASLSASKDQAAIANRNNYVATFNDLSNRITEFDKERNELVKAADEFRKKLPDAISTIRENIGQRSEADIAAELQKLRDEQKALTQRIKVLRKNEDEMVVKLQPLVTETTSTVRNLGLPVTEAPTPGPQFQ